MKYALGFLLLLFCAWPLEATIVRGQHTNKDQSTAVTSTNLAYGSNLTAGNLGLACIRAGNKSTVLSITDTLSNTWNSVVSQQVTGTGNGELLQCFEAHNVAGGADTLTINSTLSVSLRIAIFEYSGTATSTPVDGSNSNSGSSSSLASNTVTPSAPNELIISAGSVDASETFTAGTNFALVEVVPGAPSKLGVEEWIQTTATATTGPMTISGSDSWGAVVFAIKVGGGAPPPRSHRKMAQTQ